MPTCPAEPLLVASDFVRRDGPTRRLLLDHLSLTLGPGERIALTGPSGSGKSLLLRALARLDPVDGGTLRWQGDAIADHDVPRFRSQVIYLAQQAQFTGGTVESLLAAPFRLDVHRRRSIRFDRQRVLAALADAGRGDSFLQQPVEQLSGGERQLVALLRALQLEPVVLLLDEPTAALDQQTTRLAERWILRWHRDQPMRAFLWATHDPDQAGRVAETSFALQQGRWVQPHTITQDTTP